ncbi:MAG: DUF4229 domain-containing protein [Enhydrobacter sp.]|nr:DUF4229 domain-containing protein [Enhydrobacter sp.]
MTISNYTTAIGRTFWILIAACVASLILGMGSNEADPYRRALDELNRILLKNVRIDDVYKKLADYTQDAVANPLLLTMQKIAIDNNLSISQDDLKAHFEYLLVDTGPQDFVFSGTIKNLLTKLKEIETGNPYVVRVPIAPSLNRDGELENALETTFRKIRQSRSDTLTLIGASFSCNYANSQCRGEVAIKTGAAGEISRRYEFYVPSRTLRLTVTPAHLLGFSDSSAASRSLNRENLQRYADEISGKSVDEARSYLSQRISEKEGTIKILDISFSGIAAFVALPSVIAGSLYWLLMHLRELSSIPLSREDLQKEGQELFYRDKLSSLSIGFAIAVLPTAALVLLVRLTTPQNTLLVLFISAMTIAAMLLSYLVLAKRRRIQINADTPPADAKPPSMLHEAW